MRETSPGNRVGRDVPRGPNQRHPPSAHLVHAEQEVPALFPTQPRPLQRQVDIFHGQRRQTSVADSARTADQL